MLAGPLLLIYAQLVFNLYLIRRYLDDMIDALPNCRYFYIWGESLRKQGWYGGMILLTNIGGMVMMPRISIRMGDLDPQDEKNFPPYLKRLLKIKAVLLIISGIWLLTPCGLFVEK